MPYEQFALERGEEAFAQRVIIGLDLPLNFHPAAARALLVDALVARLEQ
jgi:hypothetical protein